MSGAGPETWTPMKASIDEKRYREPKEWGTIQWGLPAHRVTHYHYSIK